MPRKESIETFWFITCVVGFTIGACTASTPATQSTGGAIGNGGMTGVGGTAASQTGGVVGSGGLGLISTGGTTASGGVTGKGGATDAETGGAAIAGAMASGGATGTGGSRSTGGSFASGGTTIIIAGGSTANGGSAATGGLAVTGGTSAARGGVSTGGGVGTGDGTGGVVRTGGSVIAGGSNATGGATATGGTAAIDGAPSFHCVNWADPGDNFQNGVLQPSGLTASSDTYAMVLAKANAILSGFQTVLNANSIRIPINEPTATNATWWPAYKGIFDAAISKNMKVMVGYWFKPGVGTVPDMTAFYNMWQAVVDAYGTNDLVYFDVINEPSGYSPTAFINLVVQWMAQFPSVPANRVVVAGNYNDSNVTQQGADSRLAGCLLSVHLYAIGSTDTNESDWTSALKTAVGSYANRTIVSEYGAPMTDGTNYNGAIGSNAFVAYMQGVTSQIRASGMGSCYWPGLRNGDWYSITTLNGTGTNLSLTVNNASGLGLIQAAWGM
jgi:hypothetical protein